jgi:hypothetical protein
MERPDPRPQRRSRDQAKTWQEELLRLLAQVPMEGGAGHRRRRGPLHRVPGLAVASAESKNDVVWALLGKQEPKKDAASPNAPAKTPPGEQSKQGGARPGVAANSCLDERKRQIGERLPW